MAAATAWASWYCEGTRGKLEKEEGTTLTEICLPGFDSTRAFASRMQVVVTGLGTLTSLGSNADTFFNNLLDGKCGIGPVTRFNHDLSAIKIASEVQDFDISEYWDPKDAKRCVRCVSLPLTLTLHLCRWRACSL